MTLFAFELQVLKAGGRNRTSNNRSTGAVRCQLRYASTKTQVGIEPTISAFAVPCLST